MNKYKQMALTFRAQRPICDYSPLHVYIEPTNECNLSCSHCPQSTSDRPKGFMDFDLYVNLIEQVAKMGVEWVYLFHGGEPMLHPRIEEIVAALPDGIMRSMLHTNGTINLSRVTSANIIRISVNETPLSMIYKNIDLLAGDERHNRMPTLFHDYRNNAHNWRGATSHNDFPDGQGDFRYKRIRRCSQPYKTFVVGWDGKCYICCADYDGAGLIGDANESSLQEIWNGPAMQEQRLNPTDFCRDCTMVDTIDD